ncbi:MAG: TIGR04283 family arsenosugar biosynthesis glycosyltransferase [Gemmataceae bacterium]
MQLSIVIPTLNEAEHLEQAVGCARKHAWRGAPEIIVSDCGSRDETVAVAQRLCVHVVQSVPHADSKAAALNRGAACAGGNVLLFLDADSLLPAGYDAAIECAMAKPGAIGGAFQFALDGPQWRLRIVEVVNRIRYRLWPRYYGDQGLFVRVDVFRRAGAFPKRRLMEAAVFSGRLARFGRLVLVNKCMKTSPRRFVSGGILRVLTFDAWLWWLDWLGYNTDSYAAGYWRENHERG